MNSRHWSSFTHTVGNTRNPCALQFVGEIIFDALYFYCKCPKISNQNEIQRTTYRIKTSTSVKFTITFQRPYIPYQSLNARISQQQTHSHNITAKKCDGFPFTDANDSGDLEILDRKSMTSLISRSMILKNFYYSFYYRPMVLQSAIENL